SDIALEVTAAPAHLPIRWQAIRNPQDHASLGAAAAIPTVTRQAGNFYHATLDTNQKGSFRVRAYISCNTRNDYDEGEPSIPLNPVLADATLVADNTTNHQINATTNLTPAGFSIRNGQFRMGAAAAGVEMEVVADVTGGGADGRLGIDKVFAGLVNVND